MKTFYLKWITKDKKPNKRKNKWDFQEKEEKNHLSRKFPLTS